MIDSQKVPSVMQRDKSTRQAPRHNSFDEALDESNAFLQCAYEAQALGRLNEAHNYLILAHGRLVGLGRLIEQGSDEDNRLGGIMSIADETCQSFQSSPDAVKSLVTPHGAPASRRPKITPSPPNANNGNGCHPVHESNNLSGHLAHWSQELLYRQKGIGNRYTADKEKKAHNKRQREIRAASFDSKETMGSSTKEKKVGSTNMTTDKHASRDHRDRNVCSLSSSVMTSNSACLDAKLLLKGVDLLP